MKLKKTLDTEYYKLRYYYMYIKKYILLILNRKIRDELKRNAVFLNMYRGRRCFVVGNGPSLNTEDLSLLEPETVFTVNQISRHKDFKKLKTNFHIWADPDFYTFNKKNSAGDFERLKMMERVNTEDNRPICFMPVEGIKFVKENDLDKKLNIHFFAPYLDFYEGFNKTIDYTKMVPSYEAVVLCCISMAIYMGFSEIYLLGCDHTGIISIVNSALNKSEESKYAYELSENEKTRMNSMFKNRPLETYVYSYLESFYEFRRIYEYCLKRNIKRVNCSSETVIPLIPRKSLNDVLSNS